MSDFSIVQSHPLAIGLVSAWAGSLGIDMVSGKTPLNTAVTYDPTGSDDAWVFATASSSILDFGTNVPTEDLHERPATFACFATTNILANTALMCHSDVNVDRGWTFGYCNTAGNAGLGVSLVRSTTNVRKTINESPSLGANFALVVTSTGDGTAAGLSVYLDGTLGTVKHSSDGVGTTGAATAEELLIGRRRYDNQTFHDGRILVALVASRVWSPGEVALFSSDPFGIFRPNPAMSFGGSL